MKSLIRALAELILENIDVLEADCAGRDIEVPSLQEPFKPGTGFALDKPDVRKASSVVVAAAQQLIHTVRPPQVNLLTTAYGVSSHLITIALILTLNSADLQHTLTGGIRVAVEFHIADILKEAGPSVGF